MGRRFLDAGMARRDEVRLCARFWDAGGGFTVLNSDLGWGYLHSSSWGQFKPWFGREWEKVLPARQAPAVQK